MRRTALALSTALLLAACSGGEPSAHLGAEDEVAPPTALSDRDDAAPRKERTAKQGSETRGARAQGGSGDNDRSSSGEPPAVGDGTTEADGEVSLPLPAAGRYSYVQTGWEELCQAAGCDRSDLPPNQAMEISFRHRGAERAEYISETRNTGSRTQKLTYEVRPNKAFITGLASSFSAGGFRYTTEIVPDPAVVAAIFPLEVGRSWSGSWEDRNDDVDGTYRFEVAARDRFRVGGREENVVVIDVRLDLTGELEGFNEMRLWIVPRDLTVAATKGSVDVDSQYGTYRSRFTTSYRSGPRGD
ncbi:MAG TPA: hypothetical protein VFS18_02265 [Actinomycetota bacterium]|nr:hypothetical protein [Actinomycetota bacterium]